MDKKHLKHLITMLQDIQSSQESRQVGSIRKGNRWGGQETGKGRGQSRGRAWFIYRGTCTYRSPAWSHPVPLLSVGWQPWKEFLREGVFRAAWLNTRNCISNSAYIETQGL